MSSSVASRGGRRYSPNLMSSGSRIVVEVGDVPVALQTNNAALLEQLERRFHRFANGPNAARFAFDITVVPEAGLNPDADVEVSTQGGRWEMRRGDFHATWDPDAKRGSIRQALSPYAADSVLRILHTLLLCREQGFLLHASSVVRNGRAFLFTGPSGAGKTTIVRHAPEDAVVLTDEISYVKRQGDAYCAYGTPFAGEWADVGAPIAAPIAAIFQLARGPVTTRTRLERSATVRVLMRNILFFANDSTLAGHVFDTACDFAAGVPAYRLAFAPGPEVWETLL